MLSPFFAWFFNKAKMRSCLRMRFAPSISLVLAISTNSVTGLDLRSDRCMDVRVGGARRGANAAIALFDLGFDAGDGTAPVMATRGFERQLRMSLPISRPRGASQCCKSVASSGGTVKSD